MRDLADRLASRIQLTSDGHKVYLDAVERAFGDDIDYAMLGETYGAAPEVRSVAIAPLSASARPSAPSAATQIAKHRQHVLR